MHMKGYSPPMRRACGNVRGGVREQGLDGLFDFLGKAATGATKAVGTVVNPLQSAAQSVIQVKQALDQSKLAWSGIPYTVNEQGFAIPTVQKQAGSTGERFVPQTTAIAQTSNDSLSKSEILQIQQLLKQKGFDPGPLDGLYGPKTKAGIQAFQQANGLPVTGAATFDLLQRLSYRAPSQNPTAIPNNPSQPVVTSQPQAPVYSPTLPYYQQQPQVVTVAQGDKGLPSWAIPAMIGGGGLLLVLAMGSTGGRRR